MKKFLLVLCALMMVLSFSKIAKAELITFDGLWNVPDLYQGFVSWKTFNDTRINPGCWNTFDIETYQGPYGNTYNYPSNPMAMMGGGAPFKYFLTRDSIFNFDSAFLSSFNQVNRRFSYASSQVIFTGWLDDNLKYSKTVFLPNGTFNEVNFNFAGINRLEIQAVDGYSSNAWLMDNFQYSIPVPEPTNAAPLADAGNNFIISSENQKSTIIQGTASDPDGDIVKYRWLEGTNVLQDWGNVGINGEAPLNLATLPNFSTGSHSLILEVNDGRVTSTDEMTLAIDNSAPYAAPDGGGIYPINTSISIGGQVSDFDGDELSYQWLEGTTLLSSERKIKAPAGGNPYNLTPEIISNLPLGKHTLTLQVNDGINPVVSSSIIVEIIDTEAPSLAPASDKTILWPPNHQMVTVTIFANAKDNSVNSNGAIGKPIIVTASVASNEPQNGLGDGDLSPDWTTPVINNGIITFQLRAERSGKGTGRIYTIAITATDEASNSSTAQFYVSVPHDENKSNNNKKDK